MGERSKGKLSHASSYVSSRVDRFNGGVPPAETYWKNQRRNQSLSNWQRERRQAGGTDNPGAAYYNIPNIYRRNKKIPPNSSPTNYSTVETADLQYRCPQNHRVSRNKISNINNMAVIRKGNEFKDVENDADDADDDEDDEDDLGGEPYYLDEVNGRDEVEENQDESCGSETEKEQDDLEEEVEDYEVSPPLQRFPKKYEKDPTAIMERLKMLDQAQERLKLHHERHFQKKYQEMAARRGSQDIPEHDVTDDATEDDEEISPNLYPVRKIGKQLVNCRQPSSWLPNRNPDKYSPIRSTPNYPYLRKNETTKLALEPLLESYGQKRTCRYCGGTGSYPEPSISRKNNCRVHEAPKVSFNTKEKFGVDGESGDPGERSRRRNFPALNFENSPALLSSQKPRRSRNSRSPTRG